MTFIDLTNSWLRAFFIPDVEVKTPAGPCTVDAKHRMKCEHRAQQLLKETEGYTP